MCCIDDEEDVFNGELADINIGSGRPLLHYRDIIKRDLHAPGIDISDRENDALDRTIWHDMILGKYLALRATASSSC